MHSPLALLAVLAVTAHTASAIGICTHFLAGSNPNNAQCDPTSCKARNINFGETINDLSPGITCFFNVASDVGFDAQVCSGTFLSGNCLQLSQLSSRVIDSDRNWQPPFPIFSIKRTGN